MLAVTSVYGCRYCSCLHSREALKSGIREEEIARLLNGILHNCPKSETTALLNAQHWADSNAKPDAQAARKLEETQGSKEAKAMNLVLRFNRMGDLSGNPLNGLLYRISLGRWGK